MNLDPADSVTMFWCGLDVDDALTEGLGRLLDSEERGRAERFASRELQRRFTVAHGALRLILSSLVAASPESLVFERGPFGKPKLAATGSLASRRHFGFSHSMGIACVAVSASDGIGVDVECERSVPDAPQLLTTILTPAEHEVAVSKPDASPSDLAHILRKCWTMKEAVLKASGCGLSVDPREVVLNRSGLDAALHGDNRTQPAWCEAAIIGRLRSWSGHVYSFALPMACGAIARTAQRSPIEPNFVYLSEARLRELLCEAPLTGSDGKL
jgi:4'-phosphopantetheinyl transferase